MKVAILTFFTSKIGGVGTQARDFAVLAEMAGHEAALFNIEHRHKNDLITQSVRTSFAPNEKGTTLKLACSRLGTGRCKDEAAEILNDYDVCIWIGVAPHLDLIKEEDDSGEDLFAISKGGGNEEFNEQQKFFIDLLNNGKKHIAFATDKFIEKYYTWVKPHLKKFHGRFAFAEPYAESMKEWGKFEILPIAPLEAWNQREFIKPSTKKFKIFWPHQFRGWKCPELFCETAERIDANPIRVYACGGEGHESNNFRKSALYKRIVKSDALNPDQKSAIGNLEVFGFVPMNVILNAYKQTATTIDLTGISATLRKPNSYMGNFQCASIEPMCFGSALIKFSSTVAPYNGIPRDAVLLLEPEVADYAPVINSYLKDGKTMDNAAKNAWDWIHSVGEPEKCFQRLMDCAK